MSMSDEPRCEWGHALKHKFFVAAPCNGTATHTVLALEQGVVFTLCDLHYAYYAAQAAAEEKVRAEFRSREDGAA